MRYESIFPNIITNLPNADIPIEGLTSYLFQGPDQQIIFMSFESDIYVPEHSHEAQWGVVLSGEIELTINDKKQILEKGDTYFIPRNVSHSASIKAGYKDMAFFDQKNRYKEKNKQV